jgi:hypothetical protein
MLIDHETTDPSVVLGAGNGNAFLCTVLSTAYESRWIYAKRLELVGGDKVNNMFVDLYLRLNVKHSSIQNNFLYLLISKLHLAPAKKERPIIGHLLLFRLFA